MSVGSINANSIGIDFLVAQTPAGMIADQAIPQAEELTTPGVNGRRWRTLFDQFPSFEMTTYTEVADYDAGITRKAQAESLIQSLCRLVVQIGNHQHTHRNVHVSAALVILHPGPLVGAGAGNGQAHMEVHWQLELTDFGLLG